MVGVKEYLLKLRKMFNYQSWQMRAVTLDFQKCGMYNQQRLRSACTLVQSDQSLCLSLDLSMSLRLRTEHKLEFLSATGGCTGLSESTLAGMPHCWKSHITAHVVFSFYVNI